MNPRPGPDEIRRRMAEIDGQGIAKYGFIVRDVSGSMDHPRAANRNTHGLPLTFQHPDIQIVYPIPSDLAMILIQTVVDWIKEGNKIEPGKEYDFVLVGYNVLFTPVDEVGHTEKILRMILPDRDNNLQYDKMAEKYQFQWTTKCI